LQSFAFKKPNSFCFMTDLVRTQLGRLRIIGFAEGISYLVLLGIAMPLKYIYQMPQMVRVTGMIHGLLFVLYVLFVVIVAVQFRWSIWKTTLAFIASLVPFGTFWADVKLFRPENQP
jgi:integral membrane protein